MNPSISSDNAVLKSRPAGADRVRVAIVGCGPAGSAMALELLSAGIAPDDIVMFDRARFPRPKLCGGGITHRGRLWLAQRDLVQGCRHLETDRLSLRFGTRQLIVAEPGPQWLVDRAEFDAGLLQRCRDAGIEVRESHHLAGLRPTSAGWRLEFKHGASVSCIWVVGADGAASAVRRLAGLPAGRTGRLVEAVFRGHGNPRELEFNFDTVTDGIPGYGWIFPYPEPRGGTAWKIGVMDGMGVARGQTLRDWTMRYARDRGFELVDELCGWPEHYYGRGNRGHAPGLLLVGEAYGIDPLLGEGITPALQHAAYAARRLRQALDDDRLVCGGFERDFLWTEPGWNLNFQRFLADRLYGPDGRRWLEVLFAGKLIRRLGQSATVAYGQMARRPLALPLALAEGWVTARS